MNIRPKYNEPLTLPAATLSPPKRGEGRGEGQLAQIESLL